jgi:hypothetical protein
MTPILRPRRLQAAPHPDLILVSLADISPFLASALQPHPFFPSPPPHRLLSPPRLLSSTPAAREKEGWYWCLALVHLVNLRDYTLRSINTGSPATIWEPSSLSGPHSHNLYTPAFLSGPARAAAIAYRAMLSSRARAPRESLRIQPEVSKRQVVVAASSNIGTVLARWHNPAYTLFPPDTARAVAAAYRAPTLIPCARAVSSDPPPDLNRSLYLGLSLHLHLSLPLPPPPPLLVLLCRPPYLSPRPPASRIVGNPD